MDKTGVIYILTNPSFPEYVKIGYADDIDKRLQQLNRSECIPFAFRVYATYEVNSRLSDLKIHSIIDKLNPNLRSIENFNGKQRVREFYAMSPEDAYSILEAIAEIHGCADKLKRIDMDEAQKQAEETAQEIDAEHKERQSPFRFSMCNIQPGEEIEYCNNPEIKCTVVDDKTVSYQGQSYSLSSLAQLLTGSKYSVAGPRKVVSQDEDVPTIFGDRFILKLHGDFKHNNFVLKEEDYLNYSENFKLIETLVKSIFSTNTVVFIGYSLNDYNIKLILNWTKTLLKGSFREPIFLYVGSSALTDTELIYQQSKGLTVVEWNKLITSTDDYLDRYNAIFAALKNQSKLSLEGKSEDEAFEILYNLLQPLDRLNALRIEDVSKRLYPYIRIRDDGVIGLSQRDDLLLKRFFAINLMPDSQQNNLTKDVLGKYHCILNVFRKARILEVEDGHKYRRFVAGEVPFADKNCILFDYSAMHAFSEKTYKSLDRNIFSNYSLLSAVISIV